MANEGEKNDAGQPKSEPARKRSSRDPQVFVLLRELSEVHLLLDNVSANPNNTVSERSAVKRPKELKADWIEDVCQIAWPSDGSDDEKAEDAALLIRAKDHLNRLSHPASGATIAFTLLVTQGGGRKRWWPRRLRGDDASPTRNSLAQAAYPDLVGKAAGFRRAMGWISIGLVAALVMTCILSWYVAYGNAALSELAAARDALTLARTEVTKAAAPLAPIAAPENRPQAVVAAPASAAGPARDALPLARTEITKAAAPLPPIAPPQNRAEPDDRTPAGAAGPRPVALAATGTPSPPGYIANYCGGTPYTGAAQEQVCETLQRARLNLMLVEQRLASWTCWRLSGDCLGERAHEPGTNDVPSHAAAIANILGSAVLPFLYGLLGAGAAIIRSLSRKIKASLLSPRDLHLSFQQLALGAVVGACIGLFVAAPGTDTDGDSLLGPVTLSASAISFVAGFGVESVFQALEALISRIFNISPAASGGSGASPPGP
ncbi:MAG TPA: hypothetical protein VEW71_04640 [Allosphingosinicella sp.]|nr:hypothetical protein [Allosphingosinicella sp.]